MPLYLSGDTKADALLTDDSLALLIGMVLDQQVPLEWAFAAPLELKKRLGGKLAVKSLAAMAPEELVAVFVEKPALHRYPASMAQRVYDLCQIIVTDYGGKASNVWTGTSDAKELLGRLKKLPGFGDQKARIFLALLGKQLSVRPDGWTEASAPFGDTGTLRSVADIIDAESLQGVRAWKAAAKQAAKAANAAKAEVPEKASKMSKAAKALKSTGAKTTPMKKAAPTKKASKSQASS